MRNIHSFFLILLIIGIYTGVLEIKLQGITDSNSSTNSEDWVTKDRPTNEVHIPTVDSKIAQLDSPPATFTGNFWDFGVDTDHNDRFDFLCIAVEINVTLRQHYRLILTLSRTGESFSKLIEFSMDPGINIVNISFEASPIHKRFFLSNQTLFLHISHVEIEYITPPSTYWYSDSLDYPYTTQGYLLNELELDPFPIDSNAFFRHVAAFEGWSGVGTLEDPFVIDGLYVNSLNTDLEVKDTTIFFVIINFVLVGGTTEVGISLENVCNAFITNNEISNYYTGIHLENCHYITIDHNRIYMNYIGIQIGKLWYSGLNTVVEPSNNVSIIKNLFYNNIKYGVYINTMSQYNRIIGNDFLDNNRDGTSQSLDQGKDNIFVSNYWQSLNKSVQSERYLIDGTAQNKDFAITATPNHLTNLVILTPNGGEIFTKQVVIRWLKVNDTFNQNLVYTIFYSANAGASWVLFSSGDYEKYKEIDQNEKEYCRCVGTIPSAGNSYLIRIFAEDPIGFILMNTSATTFTIENPSLNSSIPTIGQILGLGSLLFFITTIVIIIRRNKLK